MATPETNEKCCYVQHDPHKCKIKLEKFHFGDILCRFGVIKESLLGGAEGKTHLSILAGETSLRRLGKGFVA